MKNKIYLKISTLFLFLLIYINFITASTEIIINVEPSFYLGETVSFNYTIISDTDQKITYLINSICPSAPVASFRERTFELKANQPYSGIYYDQVVQDWFEPQTCTAYVQILSPIQQTVSKNFTINTNPSFSFNILLDKKIFTQNEEITIDYDSSVENPTIDATLTSPDEKTKQISLPYTFTPEQIGTYNLNVTASKEGYKTITKTEQFGIIESEVQIDYNTPKIESKDILQPDNKKIWLYVLIGGIVFIFIVLIFIAYNLLKRN